MFGVMSLPGYVIPCVAECNQFCEEWASALMTGDADNPEFIRQVVENYRLKVTCLQPTSLLILRSFH